MSEREGQEQQSTRAQQCVQHIVELISNPYTTEPISPIRWSTIVAPYLRQRGFSPHSLKPLLEASMKSIQTEVENSDAIQRAVMSSNVAVAKAVVLSCVGDEAPLSN